MAVSQPRVLVCGAWDVGPGYPRPQSLMDALKLLPVEAVPCRLVLPGGSANGLGKKRLAGNPLRWPGYAARLLAARGRLRRAVSDAVAAHRPDVLLVPYPGHIVAPWIRAAFDGPLVLPEYLTVSLRIPTQANPNQDGLDHD